MSTHNAELAVRRYREIHHLDEYGGRDLVPPYAVHVKSYNYLLGSWFAFAVTDLPSDRRLYEITYVQGEDYVAVHPYTLDYDSDTKVKI